jgi:hypothetical protein
MKRIVPGLLFFYMTFLLGAQGTVGSWRDHLSYSTSHYLAGGDEKIYSSAGASLLVRDIQTGSLSSLSRVSGLNETLIGAMAWCEDEQTLIIVYRNTGVDLLRKGVITNIPDIKNKYIPGLKEIYSVTVSGDRALLSGSFGIVVINVTGRYVADTWKPGPDGENNEVYETAIINDRIYAATAKGVYFAPLSRTGLSYFDNWEMLGGLPSPNSKYTGIAAAGSALFIIEPGASSSSDSLFRVIPGQSAALIYTSAGGTMRSVDASNNSVCVSLPSSIKIFSPEGTEVREITGYGWTSANPVQTLFYRENLWIADASSGLISTADYSKFTGYSIPGPYTNNVADIRFAGTGCYITGGTVDNAWGNVYRPFQVFTKNGETWNSKILYGSADRDAMRVVADPADDSHFIVSSWGNGIYEFREGEDPVNYNQYNSPLASINPGENYTRICGLAYDRTGNLWMTQSGVPGNLRALKKDGSWISASINLNVPVVGDMLITGNDHIWALLPRGYGLLVYDLAGTPENISDDRYIRLQVEDAEGHVMNNVFSITEDRDGNIWVGTDQGPAVYYNPSKVFSTDLKAARIKIPRNDGSGLADYLLGTETVTTVAVDGANRKWFGTMSSGAYLMSDDGKEELLHFTGANSPMLSDNLVKISVDGLSGDVWFGTSEGIVSYRGDATAGKDDYSGMYVFPNPVREDYEGPVTVTGLVEGSSVKITDISGNLVFETVSLGGQVTWDLNNYRSARVATGVYLVFCSNTDGSLTAVTKLLVIR